MIKKDLKNVYLNDTEYNAITKIANCTGCDCCLLLRNEPDGSTYVYDIGNEKPVNFAEAMLILAEFYMMSGRASCRLSYDEENAWHSIFAKL